MPKHEEPKLQITKIEYKDMAWLDVYMPVAEVGAGGVGGAGGGGGISLAT